MEKRLNNIIMKLSIADSESGKAASLAMVFAFALIAVYLKYGRKFLIDFPPIINAVILVLLAVVGLFSVGCFVHMVILGDRSKRELRDEIKIYVQEIKQLHEETNRQLNHIESRICRNIYSLTARGMDYLGTLRRINAAIGRRLQEIEELLATGDTADLFDAHNLLNKKLITAENSLEALIDAEPVPPLAPEEWAPAMDKLFEAIDIETRKIA